MKRSNVNLAIWIFLLGIVACIVFGYYRDTFGPRTYVPPATVQPTWTRPRPSATATRFVRPTRTPWVATAAPDCYQPSQVKASLQGGPVCVSGTITTVSIGTGEECYVTGGDTEWSKQRTVCRPASPRKIDVILGLDGKALLYAFAQGARQPPPEMAASRCLNFYGDVLTNQLNQLFLRVTDWGTCDDLGAQIPTSTRPAVAGCPAGCASPPPGCVIKGNISISSGEKIYHVPGQAYYDQTNIDPAYGERWFCTEAEARANGWRKPYE